MNIGDLGQGAGCRSDGAHPDFPCECIFCNGNSNRIGVVLAPAPRNSYWVMFDCGEWRLDDFDFARGEAWVVNEHERK